MVKNNHGAIIRERAASNRYNQVMKLHLTDTSPFARFVLVSMIEYDLPIPDLVWASPWSLPNELTELNPFSMVPTLVLDDGEILYDSTAIVHYLTHNQHMPQSLADYQTWALGKTLLETAFRHVSLKRYAPDDATPHPFIDRTEQMMINALGSLKLQINEKQPSLTELQLVCALDYINFRLPELAQQYFSESTQNLLANFNQRSSFARTSPDVLKSFGA